MSEINKSGGESGREVQSGVKPKITNPKIKFEKFKQDKDNGDTNKIKVKKIEKTEKQKKVTKEQLSEFKKEVGIFEGTEPDMKMCSYQGLRIKFPGKKIKNIINITSSTGGKLSNYKMPEDKLTFNVTDKSGEKKEIDEKIIHNDTVQFDWITPNTEETILSFVVELEDGTKEIIKRKVKLPNKPFTVKEPKTRKSLRDNKVTVEKIREKNLIVGGFIGETPDTKNKPYKGLIIQFYLLQGKKIKEILSIDDSTIGNTTANFPGAKNMSVIDGDKIKFDYYTPKTPGVTLKFWVEFTDGTREMSAKMLPLPNNNEKNK